MTGGVVEHSGASACPSPIVTDPIRQQLLAAICAKSGGGRRDGDPGGAGGHRDNWALSGA
jgi:hypothetical protein